MGDSRYHRFGGVTGGAGSGVFHALSHSAAGAFSLGGAVAGGTFCKSWAFVGLCLSLAAAFSGVADHGAALPELGITQELGSAVLDSVYGGGVVAVHRLP